VHCCALRCPRAGASPRGTWNCVSPNATPSRARLCCANTFAALGIGLFEFAAAWWGSVDPMRRGLVVEGLELIEAAARRGRGIIVVSGHFTTLGICGRLMCDHVPLAGMYRPHAEPAMEWAVKRGRLRYAAAMFTKQELRPAVKHLKQGGVLWYAPDQDPSRGDSVYVPVLRPARQQPVVDAPARAACRARRSSRSSMRGVPMAVTRCDSCPGSRAFRPAMRSPTPRP
jgi:hypothetical protein